MSDRAQVGSQYRQDVLALLEIADPDAAYRYRYCESPEHGWLWHCSAWADHPAKYIPNRCMLRICPSCAEALADKARAHYRDVFKHILEAHNPKHYRLKLLTLTRSIGANDDPGGMVRQILDDAEYLYRLLWEEDSAVYWHARRARPDERNRHVGFLSNFEVGENGHKYHVHAILLGRYIPQDEISRVWQEITGDSIVDIREMTADDAALEGLKYVTKFTKLSPETLVQLHTALKGTRRLRSYGVFYLSAHDKYQCAECKRLSDGEPEPDESTVCEECGAPMRYSREVDYERWAAEQAEHRRERDLAALRRISESLLHLTAKAIKFDGDRAPPMQTSLDFEDQGDGILLPDKESGL